MCELRDPKWKPNHAPIIRVAAGKTQRTMVFAEGRYAAEVETRAVDAGELAE